MSTTYKTGVALLAAARAFQGYDDEARTALTKLSQRFARDLKKQLRCGGTIRTNEAGIAVSADVYLHDPAAGVYVMCAPYDCGRGPQIMYRGCSPADTYGTRSVNQWADTPTTQEAFEHLCIDIAAVSLAAQRTYKRD